MDDPLTFHCIHCGQSLSAEASQAGAASACPACGGSIHVPGAMVLSAAPAGPPPLPAPAPAPAPAPPPAGGGVFPSHLRRPGAALRAFFASAAFAGLLISCGLVLVWFILRPLVPWREAGGAGSFMLAHALVAAGLLVAGLGALPGALLIAGLLQLFRRPFLASFSRAYGVLVITIALLVLSGSPSDRDNARQAEQRAKQQAEQAAAVAKAAAESRAEEKASAIAKARVAEQARASAQARAAEDATLAEKNARAEETATRQLRERELTALRYLVNDWRWNHFALLRELYTAESNSGYLDLTTEKLLTEKLLKEDTGIRETDILEKIKKVAGPYGGRIRALTEDYLVKFEKLDISPELKNSKRAALQNAYGELARLWEEKLAGMLDESTLHVKRLGLLRSARKSWSSRDDGGIHFTDEEIRRNYETIEERLASYGEFFRKNAEKIHAAENEITALAE